MEPRPSSRASANRVPAALAPSAATIQDSTVVPLPDELATEDAGSPDVDDDWDTHTTPNFFASSSIDIAPAFSDIRPRGRAANPISGKPKPKPKPKPASTPIHERPEEHLFPPQESPAVHPEPSQTRGSPDIPRSYFRKYIRGGYISLIAPSFIHGKSTLWDLPRLENRLSALQTWVWAANAALFAASAALLALADVSRSAIAQSFVVLSGIFGLYGFVYAVFLAFHIGDSQAQFSVWFIDHANSMQASPSEPFWDASIIQDLEFYRAILSLICFLISLGVQIAISDLRILLPRELTEPETVPDSTSTSTLNIVQLAVFGLVIVWSSCYVVMIHHQIRRCRSSTPGSA
ncbi:hypothetical protein B0H16DRAFT_1732071 [Mycena metata]|uniref:Uncharacterized protein n=1 Tax=Mycena metata TaxID=1033252 RepID=A0AAD7MVK7_9AGAR|nr:hypothetical protein B0H16DRAFT_1732071 [Mycena metata]